MITYHISEQGPLFSWLTSQIYDVEDFLSCAKRNVCTEDEYLLVYRFIRSAYRFGDTNKLNFK